jgi:hypothetical protein
MFVFTCLTDSQVLEDINICMKLSVVDPDTEPDRVGSASFCRVWIWSVI